MTATYPDAASRRLRPARRFSITRFGFHAYLLSDAILFFAVVWHVWWLAAIGLVAGLGVLIACLRIDHDGLRISSATVALPRRRLRPSPQA
jgi:hypothetical protein